MTNLKRVEEKAAELDNNLELVAKELKRLQSIKCRLKKQSGKKTYEAEMTKVLQDEEVLKQVRQLLDPREKPVTMYEQADVDMLDYDETVKALKSIQTKKNLTQWLTTVRGDNDEFRNACRIEAMLQQHRANIRPVDDMYIRKTDLQTIIDTIESTPNISTARTVELLKGLI